MSLPRQHLRPALAFLRELQTHNTKAWFDAHRAKYDLTRGWLNSILLA